MSAPNAGRNVARIVARAAALAAPLTAAFAAAAFVTACVDADTVRPASGGAGAGAKASAPAVIDLPNGERFPGCGEGTSVRGYPMVPGAFATFCVTASEPALRQGPFVSFYPSGKPLAKGFYQAGNPDGPWTTYHENGAVLFDGTYVRGTRHGAWKFARPDGKPLLEETVDLGERTAWTEYDYENDALVAFESFVAPKGHRPLSHGRAGFVHESGNLLTGEFQSDKGQGVWEEKTPAGQLAVRVTMAAGFAEGRADVRWPGTTTLAAGGDLLRTLPQGTWTITGKDGRDLAQIRYEKGLLRSITTFHPSAAAAKPQPNLTGDFADGAPNGPWTSHHPNGAVAVTGTFARGARQGMWRAADPAGKTLAEGLYEQGLLVEGQPVDPLVWATPDLAAALAPLFKDLRAITTGRGSVESEQRAFSECMLLGDPAEKCQSLDWENAAAFHAKDDAASIDRRTRQQELACAMNNPAACARVGKRLQASLSPASSASSASSAASPAASPPATRPADRKTLLAQIAGHYQKGCDLSPLEAAWRAREATTGKVKSTFFAAEACVWLGRMLESGEAKSKAQSPLALFDRACQAGVESGCAAKAEAAAKATSSGKSTKATKTTKAPAAPAAPKPPAPPK